MYTEVQSTKIDVPAASGEIEVKTRAEEQLGQ